MDRKAMHKRCLRCNSEEIEVNAELFCVIRKRNISTQEKIQEVQKILGKNPQPDINAQDGNDNWNTALHLAIKRNELEVVHFLLTQGADTTIENTDGKTPLNLAEERNHVEIIDALKSFTSKVEWPPSDTDRLVSKTSKPVAADPNQVSVFHSNPHVATSSKQAESTVLPPFSGKLRVDTKLKLSHDNFNQPIKKFHKNKQLSAIDQLRATPAYPTPHVLAQFANMVYHDSKIGESTPPKGWLLLTTASHFGIKNGYFGAAYWHPEHQQVVIAHRGTNMKNVGAVVTDVKGILFNNYVEQMNSASTFANKVVSILEEIEQEKNISFELFFTGHSLGGWLAQVTAFTTEYLEVKGGKFLKRLAREENEPPASSTVQDIHVVSQSYHPHAVVFDSPGCKDMLSQMTDTLDVRHKGHSIDLQHLDITSYLSAPNRINTCNTHLGTLYRIFTDITDMGWKEKHTPLYNLATHSMDKIVQAFDPETGQVRKDDEGRLKIREVIDWPVSAGLTGGAELNNFFKWAEHLKNYHPEIIDTAPSKVPKGYYPLRYQTKTYDECTGSLSIFNKDQQEFLECYCLLCHVKEFFKPEDLFSVLNKAEPKKEAEQYLPKFELGNESVRCSDASTLEALIPYVKRLIRLFPHIKQNIKSKLSSPQIRNMVYQHETQRYVENIDQNALDFKPEALGLKEFLTNDHQQIWQLRMVDGDAWTGMTKVYRVLQNTSCTPNYTSKGHYTILKLKRLLTVNRMINLKELLASMETPHLLMIACGTNQPVNDELRDVFKELFGTMKQKKALKIILTTQSEESTAAFLEQIARKTLKEGYITTDEHLAWSDLTASSQTEILKKTVIFQGRRVALNQLTSAGLMTDSFPLADLLQGKELRIGEEPVLSACNGYNEKYYIGRTFKHNIFIKQDISNDKRGGKIFDLLASTEQEFKQFCQQNPKANVHWLHKEKSGEIIWQQSQGNLKTLREYIDTHKSHSFTPSNIYNLLQQAKYQRVMLIADRAGTGKTTVLTHLSKQIKQYFPAHWLARIDLNNYTVLLEAQKGRKMDKGRLLEFISKEVLKLESHLEKQLFKNSFEGNEFNKAVVIVDGFDEISPSYKEAVLDMLKVLKQTSLEQMWITTRPHLREELEDNLQQLSYTLQPFSEVEQVEFLKKFWLQTSNIEVMNRHRLHVYAEALIRNLAQSISDKDKEFTGIPLQTRMLAEAFEEDFRSFSVSEKSQPELPHKLDLLGLYGGFIDRKYYIYYREKSKTEPFNMAIKEQRERDLKNIQVEHQLLALEALFTEDQVTFLQSYNNSTFSDEELARIGIAQRNNEDKPHFIHRTFAEYFVADFLINQLTKKTKQHEQVQRLLLNEVLLRMDCHVIRAFMDGLLENSKPSKEALKEYGDLLDEEWNKQEIHQPLLVKTTALLEAGREDNIRIIEFLLDSLKSGEHSQPLRVMMLAKDHGRKTAWHWAAQAGHMKAVENLWGWAKAQITQGDLKNELLLGKDLEGRTAWHGAAQRGRVEMLVKLWDLAKELQLKPEELRDQMFLSKDMFGQTAWHMAAGEGHVEVLEILCDWAKQLQLKPEKIRKELYLSKDELGQMAWHVAAEGGHVEVLEKLWDWAKELQLIPEDLRNQVYLSKVEYGQTAWHMAAKRGHVEALQKLWDWTKNLQLKPEELRKGVWLSKDNSGKTAWYYAARDGHLRVLEKLWNFAKELQLKPEELRNQVYLSKVEFGQTAWDVAAKRAHVEVLEKLWDCAKNLQLTPEELKNQVWLSKDNSGKTAWHKAAAKGHVELIEKLWKFAKELQLKPEELRNQLYLSKDVIGQTAWHIAANERHVEILEKLWDLAKELQLKPEEVRNQMYLSKDVIGQTAWHMAANKGHVEILQKLWDLAKKLQLKSEEVRNQIYLSEDMFEQTAWHMAANKGHVEILEKLWDWAKELQLKPEDIRNQVYFSKDMFGHTTWHTAAKRGHVEVLQKLWDWTKNLQEKPQELRNQLWLSKDNSGKTAWNYAVRFGHDEVLQKLYEWSNELQLKPE